MSLVAAGPDDAYALLQRPECDRAITFDHPTLPAPAGLAITALLAHGEARVVDLTSELGLAQSTVSKHLACLRDCGLVDYRAQGRQSFYVLSRPELMDLLRAGEQLLAATGQRGCAVPGLRQSDRRPRGGVRVTPAVLSAPRRAVLSWRSLWLAYATAGYNLLEGVVAIGAGAVASPPR